MDVRKPQLGTAPVFPPVGPALGADGLPGGVGGEGLADTMLALQASGLSLPEALGQLSHAAPWAELEPWWRQALATSDGLPSMGRALRSCEAIAQHHPENASAALGAWLVAGGGGTGLDLRRREWVACLPDGLHIGGPLWLDRLPLAALPDGLEVDGFLSLRGCIELAVLPPRLTVGEELDLRDCTSWDGMIPEGVRAATVRTDRHPFAIALDVWRRRRPQGDRGPAQGVARADGADPEAVLVALMATGLSRPQGIVEIARSLGWDVAEPLALHAPEDLWSMLGEGSAWGHILTAVADRVSACMGTDTPTDPVLPSGVAAVIARAPRDEDPDEEPSEAKLLGRTADGRFFLLAACHDETYGWEDSSIIVDRDLDHLLRFGMGREDRDQLGVGI